MATTESNNWQSEKSALGYHVKMFDKSIATDVTFVVSSSKINQGEQCESIEKKIIKAHKDILAKRSTVFYTMFYGEMPETKSEIVIDDVDPDAFYKALRYMYTGDIQLESELVMFILYIAKKYMIQTLANKCTSFLEEKLRPENAVTIYDQSLFFEEKDLAEKSLRIIRRSSSQALESSSIVDIRQSSLNQILDDQNLNVPEIEVFRACQAWAKRRCEEKGIEASGMNIRRILGESTYKIRFPLIPLIQFIYIVSKSEILPDADEAKLRRCIETKKYPPSEQGVPYPFKERYKQGETRKLWINFSDDEKEEIERNGSPRKPLEFNLEVESESSINIEGIYICDLKNIDKNYPKIPQAIDVTIDGNVVLKNFAKYKESVAENKNIKLVKFPSKLNGAKQTLTLKYSNTCSFCPKCMKDFCESIHVDCFGDEDPGDWASWSPPLRATIDRETGLCNGCDYTHYISCPYCNAGIHTRVDVKIPALKKQEIRLVDELVEIKVRNPQSHHMPVVGFVYSL